MYIHSVLILNFNHVAKVPTIESLLDMSLKQFKDVAIVGCVKKDLVVFIIMKIR